MRLDHQQRRQAIAQAFRDARTPSPEERLSARMRRLEHLVAEIRVTLRETAGRVDEIELTGGGESFDDWPEEEGDLVAAPSVPSLQLPGLMSPVASQALFGHS